MSAALRRSIDTLRRPVRAALGAGVLCLSALAAYAAGDATATAREIERLYRGGDTVLAMQRVDAALAVQPADPTLRFLRGVMLGESKRETEAIEVFTALMRDFPEMPEPCNNLAVLLAARGDLDGARVLLEDALRRDPNYTTAQENLGDVLLRLARRAYEAAASAPRPAPSLQRKLQLVRAIDATPSPPAR